MSVRGQKEEEKKTTRNQSLIKFNGLIINWIDV